MKQQAAQATKVGPMPVDGLLQGKCACGNHTIAGGECAECRQKRLQRAVTNDAPVSEVPPIVHDVLRSPGQPLDEQTRAFMAPRFGHDFSRIPTYTHAARVIQTKLAINKPGDEYEQDADRIADQVMATPAHNFVSNTPPRIQRFAGQLTEQTEVAPASVDKALASPGQPLEPSLQQDMERRFGYDFSRVRVHSDAVAEQSARDVNANAYTVGNNIVFSVGQFAPGTHKGRRLIAHELTHVVQQRGSELHTMLQADFAVEPTVAAPTIATLSAAEIAAAVTYNQARFTDPDEISLLRDILGLSRTPADINDEFVLAVVQYQASYGLTQDGKLGPKTVEQLSKEVIAEGTFLGAGSLGSLELEFRLRNDLQMMIDGGNTTYADYKARIQAATPLQKNVALLHTDLLTNIRNTLTWNNFARCVELLGRRAPTYWQLIGETVVRSAVRGAWNDSDVAVPAAGTTQHEEGGWVYMNLITGALTTRRAAGGGGAAILLTAPPVVANSIVIAKFHTHPNLGPGWIAGPSPQDATVDTDHGVPDIVAGTTGIDPARFDFFPSGPNGREHLAGNRGLPGAAGGLAPQGKRDGTYDEQ